MSKQKFKLVVDARPLARNVGGMTRYIAKILPHLIKCDQLEVTLYSDQPIHQSYTGICKNLKVRIVGNTLFSKLAWHIAAPLWLHKDKPDLFWSPRQHLPIAIPRSVSSVVTIHDLVWKTYPRTIPFLQRLSEQLFMAKSVKNANRIICISESTQTLLNHHYPRSTKKSSVIRHGLEIVDKKNTITTKPRGQYLLAVGTLEPRKNYQNLIRAFEEYARNGQKDLVIVGKKGWLYESIIETYEGSEVKDRIALLEDVSDQQLNTLYSQAGALISPSLDEGYGLPPLEATIHGVPLLLSDIPVYKELYPYALTFFTPSSIKEIAKAMSTLDKTKDSYFVDLSTQSNWFECTNKHIGCFIQTLTNNKKL